MSFSTWVRPEVYPVIACVVGGAAWAAYMGGRNIFFHNDVSFNKNKPRPFSSQEGLNRLLSVRSYKYANSPTVREGKN